ncbi:hypothetical protein FTH_1826 [Francisella tularensis subsp. holarctica OSU18]|nr:hypothetical protein FTH_1826 [Francisella tularensis subsp. holarctica OSU18]
MQNCLALRCSLKQMKNKKLANLKIDSDSFIF